MPQVTSTSHIGRPSVSVIIANYNGRDFLEACLKSLERMRPPRGGFEIVVVDNGSVDGSQEFVSRRFKSIRLVSLSTNVGFASAVNLGVKTSLGDFVAIVNNDVEVTAGWLIQLLAAFSQDSQVAAAAGKLLFKQRPEIINDQGGTILLSGAGFQRGLGAPDRETRETIPVGVPTGAACVIRKSDFLASGGFDDSYFAYFEDVDLGWRLWQRGRKVVYVPRAVAYHEWRATARKLGIHFRAHHGAKNSFANVVKNAQTRYLPEAALLWTLRLTRQIITSMKTDGGDAIAILEAITWCPRHLKNLLACRRRIQRYRTVSDTELVKLRVLGRLREAIIEIHRMSSLVG
jgi:GT2 family glycosyltransferase